MVGLGLKI